MDDSGYNFVNRLDAALRELISDVYPAIPNPPNCKKRASVALILRIRPAYLCPPVYDPEVCGASVVSVQERLENFFSQTWVQQGEPEALFIKRASRDCDRWTGHVALPGGKREPNDLDDRAVSVRETREETGLEIDIDHCLYIGNLPERVVSTAWAKVPLMVLCPFVYLLMRHDIKPLSLQPSEVNSAHWVPLRNLVIPSSKTYIHCDVAERLTRRKGYIKQLMLRLLVGRMLFPAILLGPTESFHSTPISHMLTDNDLPSPAVVHLGAKFQAWLFSTIKVKVRPQLLLWGLTLGIVQDFLAQFARYDRSKLGVWPTFSHWDIRFTLWLMTYKFRRQKLTLVNSAYDDQTYIAKNNNAEKVNVSGVNTGQNLRLSMDSLQSISMQLIDGYFDKVQAAVIKLQGNRLKNRCNRAQGFARGFHFAHPSPLKLPPLVPGSLNIASRVSQPTTLYTIPNNSQHVGDISWMRKLWRRQLTRFPTDIRCYYGDDLNLNQQLNQTTKSTLTYLN